MFEVHTFGESRKVAEMLVFEQDGFRQDGAKFAKRSTENVLGYFWRKNP